VVRRTIGAHQSAAVQSENHMEILQADIVQNLVVAALQEGRIDRYDRNPAFGGHPCGESHGVLLGDTDIIGTSRNFLRQFIDAGATAHGGRNPDDFRIGLGNCDQRLSENIGVARHRTFGLLRLAGQHMKRRDAVILNRVLLRGRVTFTLFRHHVD